MELNIRRKWLLLSGLLGFLFIADLLMGSVWIPPTDIFSLLSGRGGTNRVWEDILFHFRMPRALTCVLAGSALSVGGLQMQTLFRNGLAGPDVLGLTSGASLAVSLVFMGQSLGLALQSGPAPWLTAAAAASGSTLVFVVMLAFSHRLKDKTSLLIVGLMIGAATSSVVSVLQFISRAEEQKSFLLWSFGTMGRLSWPERERDRPVRVLLGLNLAAFIAKVACEGNVSEVVEQRDVFCRLADQDVCVGVDRRRRQADRLGRHVACRRWSITVDCTAKLGGVNETVTHQLFRFDVVD
jgi:iron complex transport system permease protein